MELRIVVGIASGYNRFNELQRAVEGISARVLSNELKDLETNGVIVRKVEEGATPVMVTYEPTEYAKRVIPIVNTIADWGKITEINYRMNVTCKGIKMGNFYQALFLAVIMSYKAFF
ncbi:winged helix-turn-helix transcriptional regulator [Pedobacter sp. MR22-3]|uniref:winged helix-turn-helix transcriptional regulator n=1 Tax=Pedobacter sp. MR22-3 TaxID=2994552 RepID=UPI002246A3DC|nr:helix-turn-helix domain-containing protein [Pedobacter sp. MR22-3]MCX2585837.1 helix-turn-helix domain-containing protein [Pedobacter sp. MR22-3]